MKRQDIYTFMMEEKKLLCELHRCELFEEVVKCVNNCSRLNLFLENLKRVEKPNIILSNLYASNIK